MHDSSVKVISRNTCVEKWITLTDDPLVKVIDNYICRDQCDLIIKSGEAKLQRALVSSNSGGIKVKDEQVQIAGYPLRIIWDFIQYANRLANMFKFHLNTAKVCN